MNTILEEKKKCAILMSTIVDPKIPYYLTAKIMLKYKCFN